MTPTHANTPAAHASPATPAIAIEQLTFRFASASAATVDIDAFHVARTEKVFLKGASGSGKSTLLQLIAGVLEPSSGRVSILGERLDRLSAAQRDQLRARHIGFVFQLFNLLPFMSVLDNVLLSTRFAPERAARAIKAAAADSSRRLGSGEALKNAARALLDALDIPPEMQMRAVGQLSVGQQQRVALARALLGSPELIICDEPTSAIDAPHRDQFMQLLIAQVQQTGASLLFVSHDAALERYFDRSVALSQINAVAVKAGLGQLE